MTDESVGIILDDPALVDTNASFTCPSELVLTGPISSTCMESGYWEPDPREVECKGECYGCMHLSQRFVMLIFPLSFHVS